MYTEVFRVKGRYVYNLFSNDSEKYIERERKGIKQMWKHLGNVGEMYTGILCTIFAIFCESEITTTKS